MNDENKQLLDKVIKNRLEQALKSKAEDEGVNIAFKQAMDAIDRRLELSKIDDSYEQTRIKQELADEETHKKLELAEQELKHKQKLLDQEIKKQKLAEQELLNKQELAAKEAKISWMIRVAELAAVTLIVPIMQHRCNMRYAKTMCNFEKDYTFTTTAGRSMSRLFKFGK